MLPHLGFMCHAATDIAQQREGNPWGYSRVFINDSKSREALNQRRGKGEPENPQRFRVEYVQNHPGLRLSMLVLPAGRTRDHPPIRPQHDSQTLYALAVGCMG